MRGKIYFSICICLVLLSCSKDKKDSCHTYDIEQWCEAKRNDVFGCGAHNISQGVKVCEDYQDGYTKKEEDANAVHYTKYYNKR